MTYLLTPSRRREIDSPIDPDKHPRVVIAILIALNIALIILIITGFFQIQKNQEHIDETHEKIIKIQEEHHD